MDRSNHCATCGDGYCCTRITISTANVQRYRVGHIACSQISMSGWILRFDERNAGYVVLRTTGAGELRYLKSNGQTVDFGDFLFRYTIDLNATRKCDSFRSDFLICLKNIYFVKSAFLVDSIRIELELRTDFLKDSNL